MPTLTEFLDIARREIGYVEGPNNDTKYGKEFGLNNQPWCGMFVSWVCQRGGHPEVKFAGTRVFAAAMKKVGRLSPEPRPGAICMMFGHWPPGKGHTGIVEAVRADGTFVCIEGNTDVRGGRTGGRVMRQVRSRKTVGADGGFVHLAFQDGHGPQPEEGPPYPGTVLRRGAVDNPHLRTWQLRMQERGWRIPTGGTFDQRTEEVVRKFQAEKGLEVDGEIGPITWKAAWTAKVTP